MPNMRVLGSLVVILVAIPDVDAAQRGIAGSPRRLPSSAWPTAIMSISARSR